VEVAAVLQIVEHMLLFLVVLVEVLVITVVLVLLVLELLGKEMLVVQ
jgi:hypothetical protein